MRITIFTAIVTSVFAGLIPLTAIAALANAGTLAAFIAVCAAMLVLRRREPERERKFRAPAASLVATVGILGCLYLFISLPNRTQLFFVTAQVIGLDPLRDLRQRRRRARAREGPCLRRSRARGAAASGTSSAGRPATSSNGSTGTSIPPSRSISRHIFFPKGDATAQLLNTAAIFAVGFVMRPVGAWAMGVYADHNGRKAGLTLSVSLMCVGSLMIALAPTYARAGHPVAGDPGRSPASSRG